MKIPASSSCATVSAIIVLPIFVYLLKLIASTPILSLKEERLPENANNQLKKYHFAPVHLIRFEYLSIFPWFKLFS
jgi:hypothetical protein